MTFLFLSAVLIAVSCCSALVGFQVGRECERIDAEVERLERR